MEEKSGNSPHMDSLHAREKSEFLRLLEQTGESLPRDGEKVLDLFIGTDGHVSPDYLKEKLEPEGVDSSTVDSVLLLLCRYGMAQKVVLNGSGAWYEHLHLGADHDHLMCVKCGRVVEFRDPDLKLAGQKVAQGYNFQPLVHRMTVLGLCPRCRSRQQGPAMPLCMAARGEKVRVVRFQGGHAMQGKLAAMGIVVGDVVEVLNNAGPYIINVKGCRLALGKGLAKKVMVSLCN